MGERCKLRKRVFGIFCTSETHLDATILMILILVWQSVCKNGGMISSRPKKCRYTRPAHTISLRALLTNKLHVHQHDVQSTTTSTVGHLCLPQLCGGVTSRWLTDLRSTSFLAGLESIVHSST